MGCNKSKHASVASGNTMKMAPRRPVASMSKKNDSMKRTNSSSSIRTASVVMAEELRSSGREGGIGIKKDAKVENVEKSKGTAEVKKNENLDVPKEMAEAKKIFDVGSGRDAENVNVKKDGGADNADKKADPIDNSDVPKDLVKAKKIDEDLSVCKEVEVKKMDNVDAVHEGVQMRVSAAPPSAGVCSGEDVATKHVVEKGGENVDHAEATEEAVADVNGVVEAKVDGLGLAGEMTAEAAKANSKVEDIAYKKERVQPIIEEKCDVLAEEEKETERDGVAAENGAASGTIEEVSVVKTSQKPAEEVSIDGQVEEVSVVEVNRELSEEVGNDGPVEEVSGSQEPSEEVVADDTAEEVSEVKFNQESSEEVATDGPAEEANVVKTSQEPSEEVAIDDTVEKASVVKASQEPSEEVAIDDQAEEVSVVKINQEPYEEVDIDGPSEEAGAIKTSNEPTEKVVINGPAEEASMVKVSQEPFEEVVIDGPAEELAFDCPSDDYAKETKMVENRENESCAKGVDVEANVDGNNQQVAEEVEKNDAPAVETGMPTSGEEEDQAALYKDNAAETSKESIGDNAVVEEPKAAEEIVMKATDQDIDASAAMDQ